MKGSRLVTCYRRGDGMTRGRIGTRVRPDIDPGSNPREKLTWPPNQRGGWVDVRPCLFLEKVEGV